MKRRHFLGLGILGLAGIWAIRPGDSGQPYSPYFESLNAQLKADSDGLPVLVLDLDQLDQNTDLLAQRLGQRLQLRLPVKSLASPGLLQYLAKRLDTQRFMVFHRPHLNHLARSFPQADLLLGKPMSAHAALDFYRQLPHYSTFNPDQQLTWLIDTQARLQDYAALAEALQRPLRIALEIDVGLQRGGFADPANLSHALQLLQTQRPNLHLRGLMGYDAHIARTPPWISSREAFTQATQRYADMLATAQTFTDIWPTQPLLNGAGSLTYALHSQLDTPLNEVTVGSALVKPGDFETELLNEHRPALWIASPVLKVVDGALPFLQPAQRVLEAWNPNRQQAYYLYGGHWPAQAIAPEGLDYDKLYGRSADQERLIGSSATRLQVNDWVFLRPLVSEGVIGRFREIRLLRGGQLVGRWSTLPST
ncbi:Alanine racemase [Pseudomonas sp. 8Z]|uniref:alanine racemase n=1 Tax=Pseudomonas sp. 8Z TaxID=2653166 RepID=UPI0012F2ACE6|nr:alanine racemase [Pseudomonas sp. 8Z]VXC92864.1 Alanine racemase [Pseudomonas sp. 8Z]